MKHPFNRGVKKTKNDHPLYKKWCRMKQSGIEMELDWKNNYNQFLLWAIQNGFKNNLTLSRKDKTKGFTISNCIWVSNALISTEK